MVRECSSPYPDGRNCRRIPRRGQNLCLDHRRQAAVRRRQQAEEQAFRQQGDQAADEMIRLPLNHLLHHAQECLMDVEGFVDFNATRAQRVCFMRALTAITAAIDCVYSQAPVLSEAVPTLPADEVNALIVLLVCPAELRRPGAGARTAAILGCMQFKTK